MAKLKVRQTSLFKQDLKRARKQGRDMTAMDEAISMLQYGMPLPARFRDHALTGNLKGCRECHIEPDWLLVYKIDAGILILTLMRTGSHSELFGK